MCMCMCSACMCSVCTYIKCRLKTFTFTKGTLSYFLLCLSKHQVSLFMGMTVSGPMTTPTTNWD